ncbi:hypothetical protein DFH07DRAFT_859354 [Mycena maculata]|uniref:Uncharacterized protein n=1 Tax=Mycena maculata TaxID=230809 RepID=A0AAD7HF96_9AGAR|nr:hypothetical protein DFH07DRAFT_859354 [Mycena maculata]
MYLTDDSGTGIQQRMSHVNTMADTVLVNASPEDLRAILRNMLSSKTPGLVSAFITSTRTRLCQRSGAAEGILSPFSECGAIAPQTLKSLTRARLMYGSGLGFASLPLLAAIVRSTIGCRWSSESRVADALVVVDADIDQALQSCREEIQASGPVDYSTRRKVLDELTCALEDSRLDVDGWGGEFPFERAVFSAQDLKL